MSARKGLEPDGIPQCEQLEPSSSLGETIRPAGNCGVTGQDYFTAVV